MGEEIFLQPINEEELEKTSLNWNNDAHKSWVSPAIDVGKLTIDGVGEISQVEGNMFFIKLNEGWQIEMTPELRDSISEKMLSGDTDSAKASIKADLKNGETFSGKISILPIT